MASYSWYHACHRAMVPQQSFLGALVLFLLFQLSTSADTVTAARSIADGEILLSNQQNFALGFFSPGNSNNRYLGIWYNKVPEQTVVWVANRDSPIQNSTGVLKINGDRNLVVVVGDRKTPLWSTNVSTAINNSTAKLFDSGNLVLSSSLGGTILWQSFDHPTHMFLPGMKLGLSLKTGLKWSLTSWKSRDDPARGDYSFSLDPRGSPQFFLNKGLAPRWRTGPWNGHGLSGVPVMTQSYIFSYRFVSNDDEIYMMYLVHNSSMFSTFLLDEAGSVKRQTWLGGSNRWNVFWSTPRDICDDYGRCGAFGSCNPDNNLECQCLPGFDPKSSREWYLRDWSGGCARNRSSECGKGEGFLKLVHVKVPDTSVARVDMRSSLMDCEKECLRNCSCTGYTSANINGGGSGCVAWYGELMDIREFTDGGQDFYVRVDAAELGRYNLFIILHIL